LAQQEAPGQCPAGACSQRTTLRQGLTPLLRIGACNHVETPLGRGGIESDGVLMRSGSVAGADTHGVSDGLAVCELGAEKAGGEYGGICAPITRPPRLCSRSAA